jgi:hypothetical protein
MFKVCFRTDHNQSNFIFGQCFNKLYKTITKNSHKLTKILVKMLLNFNAQKIGENGTNTHELI